MNALREAVGRHRSRFLARLPKEVAYFLAVVGVGAVVAFVIPEFRAQEWSLWAIYGLLALSFTFVWGHAGIFSFGQAAFFGIGAYAYGVAGINLSNATGESLSALVLAVAFAGIAAGILGYFIFYGNVGDVYVAIITLAVTLVLLTFMSSTASPKYHIGDALLGGYNGMIAIPPIMLGEFTALDSRQMLIFCIVLAGAVAFGLGILQRRPFGRVLAGVRENELRTQLLGYDVRRYKLLAFVLAGSVAGLAGGLYAAWGMFINPSVFSLQQAAMVAIWVLVGGRNSILGAFVGVAIVQGLSSSLGEGGGSWSPIVLGLVLIAVVLFLPSGTVPTLRELAGRSLNRRSVSPVSRAATSISRSEAKDDGLAQVLSGRHDLSEPQGLRANGLAKRFGGVKALNGVDVDFPAGTIQCLIGPNGAGKSTCFNLLVGRYAPTAGEVLLGDRNITKLRPDARAKLGVGIKMQVPSYYGDLSVFENLWLASFARLRSADTANEQAARTMNWLGMAPKAAALASVLSHGEHQWLEIGMVVAGSPSVMLLDEPTAGMTREETARTADMIKAVSRYSTVIVVEHDMGFVRALNAPVTMFHQGLVFASGSIEELRRDERVLDTYLGRSVAVDAAN